MPIEPYGAHPELSEPLPAGAGDAPSRRLMDAVPDAVLVHREQRWAYANAAAVALLGYARADEILGLDVGAVLLAEAPASGVAPRTRALPSAIQVERRARRRDGSTVAVELSSGPALFDERPAEIVVMRDVSVRNERLKTLVRMDRIIALGTLAAGVGHEINNPLAYILGNLELAADEVRDVHEAFTSTGAPPSGFEARLVEVLDVLREAREGAERVRSIVGELRSLSPAAGDALEFVPLPRVLEAAATATANQLLTRARLFTDFGPVPRVLASEARLTKLFTHLLVNAAEAIPAGDAAAHRITVSTRTDDAGSAVVSIHDTGPGIPEALLGRVFDPFFTTKPVGEGTGLGLSICQGIVHSYGGEITVLSEPGAGTTFRVELPAPPRPLTMRPRTPRPAARGARGRVLVIDDDPFIGRTVTRSLSRDHDVVSTVRGQELLERLEGGERFDVILCDLMMPDLTGMDLHDAVAARFPEHARRMVFMTGGAFTPQAQSFLEGGVARLDKPFTMEAVRETVRRFVP